MVINRHAASDAAIGICFIWRTLRRQLPPVNPDSIAAAWTLHELLARDMVPSGRSRKIVKTPDKCLRASDTRHLDNLHFRNPSTLIRISLELFLPLVGNSLRFALCETYAATLDLAEHSSASIGIGTDVGSPYYSSPRDL